MKTRKRPTVPPVELVIKCPPAWAAMVRACALADGVDVDTYAIRAITARAENEVATLIRENAE